MLTSLKDAPPGSLAWAKGIAAELCSYRGVTVHNAFEIALVKALRSAYAQGWNERAKDEDLRKSAEST